MAEVDAAVHGYAAGGTRFVDTVPAIDTVGEADSLMETVGRG